MRRPPYGREVDGAPPGYWQRGTRVLVFAGPQAWTWARWFRGPGDPDDFGRILHARERYVTVLPPDMTAHAEVLAWPVAGRNVVIVDTGAGEEALAPLVRALERDACADGEIFDLLAYQPAWLIDQRLRAFQPWAVADWDQDVVEAHRKAAEAWEMDRQARLVDAWTQRLSRAPAGQQAWLAECGPGSIGAAVRDRLHALAQAA